MKSMGEIAEESSMTLQQQAISMEGPKFAVAVGKGDNSVQAVKWAVEKLVPAGDTLHLLHVQATLRLIQTPLGPLPVDQANEESIKQAKQQQVTATEKLLHKYKQMCQKNKVEPKVHCFENDSVEEALVDQISKLGISKLVLGSSSQNRITKLFKGPRISSLVAKHAPNFCAVMVVRKGRLCSVKDANQSFSSDSSDRSIFSSSECDVSCYSTNEGESFSESGSYALSSYNSSQDGIPSRSMQTGQLFFNSKVGCARKEKSGISKGNLQSDGMNAGRAHLKRASMSQIPNPSEGVSIGCTPGQVGLLSSPANIIPRSMSIGHSIAPSTPAVVQIRNRSEIVPVGSANEASEDRLAPATCLQSPRRTLIWNISAVDESDRFYGASNGELDCVEIVAYADVNMPSGVSVEVPRQRSDELLENDLHPENDLFSTTTCNHEVKIAEETEVLKHQLNQARIAVESVQREADRQALRCKKVEEVVVTAMAMAKGCDSQKREESEMLEDALRELDVANQKIAAETRKREEAFAALEEARHVLEFALKDTEIARQQAAEEMRKCEEAVAALDDAKKVAAAFMSEANSARQQAAAERRRCEEALANLEEARKALEMEIQLRKDAEEKARQEAITKQEAIAALRRAQKRYTEYSFEELQEATNNFSDDQKLGEGGYGAVYRGRLRHTTVAIKVLRKDGLNGQQQFQREVEILSNIHHPHMVMLLGACPERACIVYEYMANGSLEDRLTCKDGTPPLPWFTRFRICSEVATALMFLHSSSPEAIVHRDLKPGNILLDHNFVSKVGDVGLARLAPNNMTYSVTVYRETTPAGTFAYMDPEYLRTGTFGPYSDVYALGILMLQLLTGKRAVGVVDLIEAAIDDNRLDEVLDKSAGDWPLSEAVELAELGLKCAEPRRRDRPDLETRVLVVLEIIRKVAEAAATSEASKRSFFSCGEPIIPSFFICPISQEVMEDPHIAADGFTYEYDIIKIWLNGHNTSPMTNLRLIHKNLIPNHSLRSAIREWQAKGRVR